MNAATKAVINWADGTSEEWFNDLVQLGFLYSDDVYEAEQSIKNYVMNVMLADVEFGSFSGELVKLAFDDINWHELALHYIERAK